VYWLVSTAQWWRPSPEYVLPQLRRVNTLRARPHAVVRVSRRFQPRPRPVSPLSRPLRINLARGLGVGLAFLTDEARFFLYLGEELAPFVPPREVMAVWYNTGDLEYFGYLALRLARYAEPALRTELRLGLTRCWLTCRAWWVARQLRR
jgi:hypothetical protein